MSRTSHVGIICIASPCGRFITSFTETADFVGGNRKYDTNDTKPPSRDTPTIQGITTMRFAGVLDADFVAKTVA
jgi:hypothetical protein